MGRAAQSANGIGDAVCTGAHTCLSSPTVSSSLVEDQLRPVTTSECFFDECSATLSSTIDKGAGKERGPRPDVERHQKYAGPELFLPTQCCHRTL